MTDPTGETTYTYGLLGQVTSVTSADGKTIRYAYDGCGRLSAITYADDRVVSYGYDLNDRLITVTDGEDVTSYRYDALGRVIETSRPNGTKSAYTYDVRGNLTELVNADADGAVISSFTYTYDLRGYIVEEVVKTADTTVTRKYQYNLSGELVEFTEREGLKLATYAYSYDDSGNRIRLAKSGVDQPETITYTYNEKNQLIYETSTIDGTTNYTYNENGSLISERTEGREEVTYEYTVEQRLAAIREGGALLMAASYDGDGNRVFQISRTQAVHYVQKEDVSDAQQTPSSPVSGSAGTTGSVQGSTSGDSIQIGASALTPIPGVAGNETGSDTAEDQKSDVYTYYERVYVDPADSIFWYGFGQGMLQTFGNLNTALSACLSDWFSHAWDYVTGQYELVIHSEEQATTYSETDVEALRSVGLSEADIAAVTGSDASEKDADTVVIPAKPSEKERVDYELTYYVNDINTENTQVLMEYGKRDQLKNVYTYGIERISVETIADTVNPQTDEIETDYYLYDGRGSVANVVSVEAKVLNTYSYDPFGNVTSGAPEFDSFYGYNAEETNPVTGMQYLRARYYDTETGRFQAADTYLGDVSEPLTLNRYSYTTNNPIMYIDPSGHFLLTALVVGVIAGAVVGAAVGGYSSYVEQKAGGGKVNGWEVAKDALVGGVIGAGLGAIGGAAVAGAAAIGTTAAIVTGVGVGVTGVGIAGSAVTNAQAKANNKEYEALMNEAQSLVADAAANVYSQQYIQQRVLEIERRRIELCEKAEKLQKQADIFGGVTSVGLGITAMGLSPVAGPQLVTMMTGNTVQAGMYVAGTMTVGNVASIGLGTVGGLGIAYGSAEVGEGASGDNWIKDAYGVLYDAQHKDQANEAEYEEEKEAVVDRVFEEHQGALDSVNAVTTVLGAVVGVENWALSQSSQDGIDLNDGLGTYNDQKGHHIMAKKAFDGNPNYDGGKGITISQAKLDEFGVKHATITGQQKSLYSQFAKSGETLTLDAMANIEYQALVNSGIPEAYARNAISQAFADLLKNGVTQTNQIPWGK